MVNEARKQIMWAVNFRSMHTAVHGLYYGKDKRKVQRFAQELEDINSVSLDGEAQGYYSYLMEDLFNRYPEIQTLEEFNYRDIVDLPGGYEGVEIGDTIYKFVNTTSIDVCNESTRKNNLKKIVKESDGGYDSDTPKIYVGTYAKYNDGSIDGKWITISDYNTYEEFVDACRELHSDESDPEFMVQDYENFPRKWYHEGGLPSEEEFDKINEFYMMDDDDKEAYEAFLDLNLWDDDSIETFQEKYEGHFNTPEDFGVHAVENFGMPRNAEYYIDYEAFGRDLTMDWHRGDEDEKDAEGEPEDPDYYYDSDGYQQMEYGSDREVGEQYIDDVGMDGLGKDSMDFYFDYDQYGRELLMTDFVEQDGFIFSNY